MHRNIEADGLIRTRRPERNDQADDFQQHETQHTAVNDRRKNGSGLNAAPTFDIASVATEVRP